MAVHTMQYKIITDNTTGQKILKTLKIICPECKTPENTNYDDKHDELYCKTCGLVLEAPPVHGQTFPGLQVIINTHIIQQKDDTHTPLQDKEDYTIFNVMCK